MKAVELSYSRSDKQVQKESFTSHLGFHEKLFEYYINKEFEVSVSRKTSKQV